MKDFQTFPENSQNTGIRSGCAVDEVEFSGVETTGQSHESTVWSEAEPEGQKPHLRELMSAARAVNLACFMSSSSRT